MFAIMNIISVKPAAITLVEPEIILLDFGRAAFAGLELELNGKTGQNIEVALGEVLTNGRLNRNPGGSRCIKIIPLTLQAGVHRYHVEILQHKAQNPALPKLFPPQEAGGEIAPFRYVEISGYAGEVDARQLAVFAPFNDEAAYFNSSNPNLNQVWELCKYSIKATTAFGMYIDGERERLPYEGDIYINQLGHFCCDADYRMAKQTIDYVLEHPTWPTEWSLIMIMVVCDYYLYSGDEESYKRWKLLLKDKLLLDRIGVDGLLTGSDKDIVDWPQGERDGYEFGAVNLVPNCYFYHALNLLGEVELAARVKTGIRARMFKNGLFVDNPDSPHNSLHGNMFALRYNLAEAVEYPKILAFIQSRGMACSVYGAQFLLEACYQGKLADYALELMTSGGLRSWRNMLKCGSTITMEAWDDSFIPNQDWNHAWGAAPANIIPRELMGIKPLTPGFVRFSLEPQTGSLEYVELRHPTSHGTIKVIIQDKVMDFTVPDGTTAIHDGIEYSAGTHQLEMK